MDEIINPDRLVSVPFNKTRCGVDFYINTAINKDIGLVLTENKRFKTTLSKILCKWKQDSALSLFLYLDSVFKNKHKLIHNQAPVMNRLCPFLLNLHK